MSRKWLKEEDEALLAYREQGFIIKDIAEKLGRTEAAVKLRCSKFIKEGTIEKLLWTKEEEDFLISSRERGLAYESIELPGRTVAAIKARASKLMREGRLKISRLSKYAYSDEEMLNFLREYPSSKALAAQENVPSYDMFVVRFGSWWNALALAGIEYRKGLQPDVSTTVYLVHFTEEDFYKIGLTQAEIKTRFKGYPIFRVLDYTTFPSLKEAENTERFLLDKVRDYWYLPLNLQGSGHTECFQVGSGVSILNFSSLENLNA